MANPARRPNGTIPEGVKVDAPFGACCLPLIDHPSAAVMALLSLELVAVIWALPPERWRVIIGAARQAFTTR